ncbi:MAG TPA: PilZ domain-containing protein [Treponemataceae bacterium]|nr:PilZ domain-containing protein [Treponemataceae bacterium]
MKNSTRTFERIPCELRVRYEFVKWNVNNCTQVKSENVAHCIDISVAGVGLSTPIPLTRRLAAQLLKGVKKIRLSLILPDCDQPEVFFARLVWSANSDILPKNRCGFKFIDISEKQFKRLQECINKSLFIQKTMQ